MTAKRKKADRRQHGQYKAEYGVLKKFAAILPAAGTNARAAAPADEKAQLKKDIAQHYAVTL